MPIYTFQDIINFTISQSGTKSFAEILTELVSEDRASKTKEMMADGDKYYRAGHDIKKKDFTLWQDPESEDWETIPNKANSRIPHPYFRKQNIEKVAYLLSQPVTATNDLPRAVELYEDMKGLTFDDLLQDLGTGTTNKGREYLHFFFDGDVFDMMVIDAQECIPIYETSRQKKLVSLIRYFVIESDVSGTKAVVTRAEWWYPDRVELYEMKSGEGFKEVGTKGHFEETDTADPNGNFPSSWGRVPFVEFKNNVECLSDLTFIREFIDALDMVDSEYANDLIDLQEAVVKATGTDNTPAEVARIMKLFKVVITTDPESDVGYMTMELPFEARAQWIKDAEQSIAVHGMAVDSKVDKLGNNPSGVALKFMYMSLDLKASMMQRKFNTALFEVVWFMNEAVRLLPDRGTPITDDEIKDFKFVFTKTMIANEKEKIELANESVGKVSEQTRLGEDPRVENVDEEIERMDEEREKIAPKPAPIQPSNNVPANEPVEA